MKESEVDIADHALRLRLVQHGVSIVAKAPDWQVTTFNDQAKLQSVLPLKNWLAAIGQFTNETTPITTSNKIVKTPCQFAGLPCVEWQISHAGEKVKRALTPGEKRVLDRESIYFYPKKVDPAILTIMAKLYSLPPTAELPVKYVYKYIEKHAHDTTLLDTKSAELTSVDPHTFDVPKGFKQTSLPQIMMARKIPAAEMKEMIESVGIGDPKY